MTYDDWKTDPEYGLSNRDLLEAELKQAYDALIEHNDKLTAGIDTLQEAIAEKVDEIAALQAKVAKMTDFLEELLDYCKDNYDLAPDPSGGHNDIPNWYMRTGTEIEDVLGRGGRYG